MRFFDLHCDTVSECLDQGQPLYENTLCVSATKASVFEKSAHCFALWVPDGADAAWTRSRLEALEQCFSDSLKDCAPRWRQGDLPLMGGLGEHTAFLTVENGAAVGSDIGMVEQLRTQGAVMMTLCWNGENRLAGGWESRGHLTGFGRCVMAEMERRGMLVDVSHLNDASFYEVAAHANEPLMASHSNARAVCAHPRNLTDAQLRLVAESGGLIGLTLHDAFVRAGGGATLDDLCRHVEHLLWMGLEDHMAVGTDFDGGETLPALENVGSIPAWQDALVARGIPEAVCDKLFYRNAAEFFTRHLRRTVVL